MKKVFFLFIVPVFLLSSCVTGFQVKEFAKDTYSNVSFYSEKSKQSIWDKVIEIFAVKGIPINVLEKDSGIIVSERVSFIKSYTFEDNDGNLEKKNAFVICQRSNYKDKWPRQYPIEKITRCQIGEA